jgi:polysaccharide biosynthesis protein PslJ
MGSLTATPSRRGDTIAGCALGASIAGVGAAVLLRPDTTWLPPLALLLVLGILGRRWLVSWPALVSGVVVVIFFIPIKRYTLPASLPFHLEPYRVVIALVAIAWLTSLLIDRRVRLRGSGLEAPLAIFVFAALASVAVNGSHLDAVGLTSYVIKTLTFFASFIVLFYVVVSVVERRSHLEGVLRLMVGCGALVAVAALVESRTHHNYFNDLGRFVPFLSFQDPRITAGLDTSYLDRSGALRAYASAAHPIELSAVLVMLIPVAVHLFRATGSRRWMVAGALLAFGALATLSRTGIVMLVAVVAVFLWLRPRETRSLWPLVIPAVCVVYFALPNTLGNFYASFFPKGGLVAQQSESVANNATTADGRLADIGPSLSEAMRTPIFGQGFGSRVTDRDAAANLGVPLARILDDQWLGTLLETGFVGVAGLLWLLTRAIRRMARVAREDDGDDGWLAVAFAASITAFAVGMLTFDALGFVQVTILLFLLLALSSALARLRGLQEAAPPPRAAE